jgi:hypothetical protein
MNYLQDQVVQNYAGTAARGSAIGSAVSQGMVSYLDDSNSLEVYKTTGTAVAGWEPVNLAQSPNVIINGGMDIWQRGTAINNVANTAYTADMWSVVTDGVATVNVTRQNIAAQGFGSQFALRAERSAGTNRWVVIGMFEGALAYVGRTMTLSFYLREGSALTSDISVLASTRTAKFGTSYDTVTTTISNASLNTSTFTRFTVTFPITTATSTANADLFQFEFSANQAGASNAFFELAGVQLEAGQTATTFRRNANSIQGELAACQRYFVRYTYTDTRPRIASGQQPGTTSSWFVLHLPVTMRRQLVAADVSWSALASTDNAAFDQALTSLTITTGQGATDKTVNLAGGHTAVGSQYRPVMLIITEGGFLAISAEL